VSKISETATRPVGPYSGVVDEQDKVRFPGAFAEPVGVRIE